MKVFVDGKLYDSRRHVIGVVLTPGDKANITAMAQQATVYAEFIPTGGATERGCKEHDPDDVAKLLDDIKARAERAGAEVNER